MVGQRMVFLRFQGCNLKCSYCDIPGAGAVSGALCTVRSAQGEVVETVGNPLGVREVVKIVERLAAGWETGAFGDTPLPASSRTWVSLTGGEPLLQAEFLAEICRALKPAGKALAADQRPEAKDYRLFLETNGTLPDELESVLPYLDMVAMDIKLPSDCGADVFPQHRLFLERLVGRDWRGESDASASRKSQVPSLFVKVVVTANTREDEFDRSVEMLTHFSGWRSEGIPLVIQPVTQVPGGPAPPKPGELLEMERKAWSSLLDVRIIPQMHKMLGLP